MCYGTWEILGTSAMRRVILMAGYGIYTYIIIDLEAKSFAKLLKVC